MALPIPAILKISETMLSIKKNVYEFYSWRNGLGWGVERWGRMKTWPIESGDYLTRLSEIKTKNFVLQHFQIFGYVFRWVHIKEY